jgi:hypothetical protein
MLVYWYSPFPEFVAEVDEFVDQGNRARQGRPDAGKKTYVKCSGRHPPLRWIARSDRLYVVGHGDTRLGFIHGEARGGQQASKLTPAQLVDRMEADGCEWVVEDIRIYACLGAVGPFVQDFAEIVARKNPRTSVYGYLGVLDRSTYPGSKVAKASPESIALPASDFRRQFAWTRQTLMPGHGIGDADFTGVSEMFAGQH